MKSADGIKSKSLYSKICKLSIAVISGVIIFMTFIMTSDDFNARYFSPENLNIGNEEKTLVVNNYYEITYWNCNDSIASNIESHYN